MKQLKEFINEKLHIGNFKQDKKKEYKDEVNSVEKLRINYMNIQGNIFQYVQMMK